MTVNLKNADNALKSYYLDAVSQQLNLGINPFFAQIKHSTEDVYGKEVRKLVIHGVNNGVRAGTEDGDLPEAMGNQYAQFVTTLKNFYGVIEITDKAIRASESNAGAFVSLLNAEMEGLINSSTYNFGRMLFGDGRGLLAKMSISPVDDNGYIKVDTTASLVEGQKIVLCDFMDQLIDTDEIKIVDVDRNASKIKINIEAPSALSEGGYIRTTDAMEELTGLGAIFSHKGLLYGLDRNENKWLSPIVKENQGKITELDIQKVLDKIEESGGSSANFIVCSWGVRRALQQLFSENRRSVDTVELSGGYKAMSYNGIPIVADRFCPAGTMYILNTNDFVLHQLCDWQWLSGDDGSVLKQVPGKAIYTATLVKYADLMCSRPFAQGMISGITEA